MLTLHYSSPLNIDFLKAAQVVFVDNVEAFSGYLSLSFSRIYSISQQGAPSGKRIRRHCTRSGWSDANKGRDPIKSRVKHDNNNKDIFGNLGGIVDSEESDGNENPYVASHRRPRGKQKHTFNSDEESIEAGSDCDVRVAKKRRAIVNDDLDDSE